MIGDDGVAAFDMEHASCYVIIVSDTSMAGMTVSPDPESHTSPWIIVGIIVCVLAVGGGCGFFFWWKKRQEETEEDEEDDWIDDDEWQEPEAKTPETSWQEVSQDRFVDEPEEDDWIDDDEWDVGNDWIDDEEWEKRKEA